ncbi:MAG: hypothetical protein V4669_13875 [Pseudomonadota bacterium]
MTSLVRYEQARSALAECHRVDEVKDIRDKAEAMAAYARQAKDSELIQYATEIKVRAERRCGELLAVTDRNKGAKVVGRMAVERHDTHSPTLADMGLTRDESSRYQSLASMSPEHFETAVATAKSTAGEVTTAFMLREAKRAKPQARPMKGAKAEAMREELKAASARGTSMLCTYARLLLGAIGATESFTADECRLLDELADAILQTRSVSK